MKIHGNKTYLVCGITFLGQLWLKEKYNIGTQESMLFLGFLSLVVATLRHALEKAVNIISRSKTDKSASRFI